MTQWFEIDNVGEIPSPALLVYPDRIQENLQRMIAWSGDAARLRPHVKTHKMGPIVRMKLDLGISKFKASTIAEVEMVVDAGGLDILMAYQPVGPNSRRLAQLLQMHPNLKLSTIVDNQQTLKELSAAATQAKVSIHVFIDLDVGMNRTGIPVGDEALSLYREISSASGIIPGGIHAYDGHLHLSDYEKLTACADEAFQPVWEFRDRLAAEGFEVPAIVASGTPTSSKLARETEVEVSAGTTVLWDRGYEKLCPQYDFLCAAVLLARVISKPKPDLLCLDLGHKAVASESPHPRVYFFGLENAEPINHSEEHLVLKDERAGDYQVGDVVYGVPHHVCPTVALHQEAWCVRDGRAEATWPVVARNRRLTV